MESKPSLPKPSSHENFNLKENDKSEFQMNNSDISICDDIHLKKSDTLVNLYSQFVHKTMDSTESLSKSNSSSSDFINSPESRGQPVVFEVQKGGTTDLRKIAMYQNNLGFFERYLKSGKIQFNNKEINALAPGSF